MDLSTHISKLPGVGTASALKLEKLGIQTVEDLLHHVPHRYIDFRNALEIAYAKAGDIVTIKGTLESITNIYTKTKKLMQAARVRDASATMDIVWFNQPYLARSLYEGVEYSFSGKVQFIGKKKALFAPEYEETGRGVHTGRLVPVYPTTARVSTKWIRSRVDHTLKMTDGTLYEFLPEKLLKRLGFMTFSEAVHAVHYPETHEEAEEGKRRLAFNELLITHIKSMLRKHEWDQTHASHKLSVNQKLLDDFIASLPFTLTNSQTRTIQELFDDLSQEVPMNRLLEGDVGSGKTIVAAAGAFAAFINGYQSIIMAPTQILAEQHFKTLQSIFDPFKARVSLVTSQDTRETYGRTDIYVGTHSLIQKRIKYDKAAFIVIDEQHRFGVKQRAILTEKAGKRKKMPHVLTMTATPIPRTIALTAYGDLALSTLDELPKGRLPITTWIVPPKKREGAYKWIAEQIDALHVQVYIVCPLIDESETETMKDVKAATVEFERLKKVFRSLKLGLLHGRMKAKEKSEILEKFKDGKVDILVSTPVVEVGIDIPNATIMMIEAADRFGLAQLHQLRGRVGRGEKKSYCLLFTDSASEVTRARLDAMTKTHSGFELAELDLQLRGPGDIFGTKQHGIPDLKIANWGDTELIKTSHKVAGEIIKNGAVYAKVLEKIKLKEGTVN